MSPSSSPTKLGTGVLESTLRSTRRDARKKAWPPRNHLPSEANADVIPDRPYRTNTPVEIIAPHNRERVASRVRAFNVRISSSTSSKHPNRGFLSGWFCDVASPRLLFLSIAPPFRAFSSEALLHPYSARQGRLHVSGLPRCVGWHRRCRQVLPYDSGNNPRICLHCAHSSPPPSSLLIVLWRIMTLLSRIGTQ